MGVQQRNDWNTIRLFILLLLMPPPPLTTASTRDYFQDGALFQNGGLNQDGALFQNGGLNQDGALSQDGDQIQNGDHIRNSGHNQDGGHIQNGGLNQDGGESFPGPYLYLEQQRRVVAKCCPKGEALQLVEEGPPSCIGTGSSTALNFSGTAT